MVTSPEAVNLIRKLILEGECKDFQEICIKVYETLHQTVSRQVVQKINLGTTFYNENYTYPLNSKYCSGRRKLTTCCICGQPSAVTIDGKEYCRRHGLQINHHGTILERTIYDKNQVIYHDDYAEIVLYDKNNRPRGCSLIDLEDAEEVLKYKWYCTDQDGKCYCQGTLPSGQKVRLHRFVLQLHNIRPQVGEVVDHINGDGLDNRKVNLRIVTQQENMRNMRPDKQKGVKSYTLKDGTPRYQACITVDYQTIHLGTFNTYEEAVEARKRGEEKYWSSK